MKVGIFVSKEDLRKAWDSDEVQDSFYELEYGKVDDLIETLWKELIKQ